MVLVGAHLRPVDRLGKPSKDLDWAYSSPIEPDPDSDSAPWAISTFQIEAHLDHSEALRTRADLVRRHASTSEEDSDAGAPARE